MKLVVAALVILYCAFFSSGIIVCIKFVNFALGAYTLSGVYTVDGETVTETNLVVNSTTNDVSGVFVENDAVVTLYNATVYTSGDTSDTDASSFHGLDAGVLAYTGSSLTMIGGYVYTTGLGANGVFSTEEGTLVTLINTTIVCLNSLGHGIDATVGGTIIATDVTITTYGSNGAAIATDRGSGTITVTRGYYYTAGGQSPGVYSTGVITIYDAYIQADGSEAAVIEGINSITLYNSVLKGAVEYGVRF